MGVLGLLGRDCGRGVGGVQGILAIVLLTGAAVGCQGVAPIESHRLIQHQAMIDFSGLAPLETVETVRMNASVPRSWEARPPRTTALYTYVQWLSPSTRTGVGAAHINLPLPISARAVLWLARREYTKKADDGKLIAEWTDELGRDWFEAENKDYHVRGYAMAQGFQAWIVYFGYKMQAPPDLTEISLAARSADTFVPLVGGVRRIAPAPTSAPAATRPAPASRPAK